MQSDVYSAVVSVAAHLHYALSGSTCSPWGRSLWNPTWWQWWQPLWQLRAPHRVGGLAMVAVLDLTCRCARRSWSRTSCSARSSTRRTCTRTFPRVWPRVCCTLGHSTAGYSPRGPAMCGYILFPECQGSPVFGPRHSNWVICSHTAGPLSQLVFFSGFSLSCVAFFSVCVIFVCCFHTYPLKTGQSFQRMTWFSNKFSQHRTQKHHDNGNPQTSALLQPESKGRTTFGCGLSFIRNAAWHQ